MHKTKILYRGISKSVECCCECYKLLSVFGGLRRLLRCGVTAIKVTAVVIMSAYMSCEELVGGGTMDQLRQCRPRVGLTTTRHGEMTSVNVTRRGQTQHRQQYHSLPASLTQSAQRLMTDEASRSDGLSEQRGRTPYAEPEATSKERRVTEQRQSSAPPLPGRITQLTSTDDRLYNTAVRHSTPYHQRRRRHHHQQQRQALTAAVDSLRHNDDDQNSALSSGASTLRSGNGTANSTLTTFSQGYFTDCESETLEHQPQRRRRVPRAPPGSPQRLACFKRGRSSASAVGDRRDFRSPTTSQFNDENTGLIGVRHQPADETSSSGSWDGRRGNFKPRSRSCDREDTFSGRSGAARRTEHTDRPYRTWSPRSSRRCWSPVHSAVDNGVEPRRLAWKLQTPHGVLSLCSARWSETSGTAAVGDRSTTSADGRRRSTDGHWLTVPRLSRRSSSSVREGNRARTLPASFRLRCRSPCVTTATDEPLGLEPIGPGIVTLECEQCYVAAMARLSAAAELRTTPSAVAADSLAPVIDTFGHRNSYKLAGPSRGERGHVDQLHNMTKGGYQVPQSYVKDSPAATPPTKPSKSPLKTKTSPNRHLHYCDCRDMH